MKKSEFLTNWRGGIDHSGEREAFKKAEASSLSSEEKEIINNGGVVLMPKDLMSTKVFLTDEKNSLDSVNRKKEGVECVRIPAFLSPSLCVFHCFVSEDKFAV